MAVVNCLNMSFNEHGNLLLYKGHPCGRLLHCETFQKHWRGQNTWLDKNTKRMPDYQAHGSLLLKFLKGVPWAILDGSEDLCFLIRISKRNTGPSLGSPLFVTSQKKQTRFWSKDLKDRRKLGLFKMQEKQEENLQTIWLKFEVFFCAKTSVLVKSTSFKADLNFISRLCSIYVYPKDLKKSQIMEWKRHHKLRISRNVTN